MTEEKRRIEARTDAPRIRPERLEELKEIARRMRALRPSAAHVQYLALLLEGTIEAIETAC